MQVEIEFNSLTKTAEKSRTVLRVITFCAISNVLNTLLGKRIMVVLFMGMAVCFSRDIYAQNHSDSVNIYDLNLTQLSNLKITSVSKVTQRVSISPSAQQLRRYQAVTAYIYNFAKDVQWQNEEAIKEFHFHVISEDKDVIQELTNLSKVKTLRNKAITVSSSATIEKIDNVQLIFIAKDKEKYLVELADKMEGKNILLVSDRYSDKRLVMINFVESENGTLRFEINKANIIYQHLRMMEDMILLGGTEIDVAALYREGQQSLRSLQKHAKNVEDNLSQLEYTIKAKTKEIQIQKDSLNSQTHKIKEQRAILDLQSQKLTKQEDELNTIIQKTREQQKILDKGNTVLQDQKENINRQKSDIESQSKILEEQGATIHKQQNLVYLLVIIITLAILLVIAIYYGYKGKQKSNLQLEQRVAERTGELHTANEQLQIELTERKRTEAQLAESEQKYRELVEHANSIILRWTSDGQISFLNEFGQKFFGYSAEEILGRHVIGTIVPKTESGGRELSRLMEQICADPRLYEQNVNENMCRDGKRVWIAWTNKIVLDTHGRVAEIFSVGSDITDRKRAEEELEKHRVHLEEMVKERTGELIIAKERAESADQIKSAFLATMSHELRTPLNSIIGFTGIILQGLAGPLNNEQSKQLSMVQNSANHLLALINDVLDISKIEAGQLEVFLKRYDFRKSIEKIISLVHPLVERKGLELRLTISPEVHDLVSDSRRVEQILINLINNAIKFTETGSVNVECKIIDHTLATVIRDTGIGIREEDAEKLFKPFSQIDTGTTRSHEGTGLGLSISKRLVEKLGGTITVQSKLGSGSTFTIKFPIDKG